MRKDRLFVIAWVLISVLLIVYTILISENNKRVIGITEVEETTVSFPFPVEVSNVTVVPNQQISAGDLLLELKSDQLERDIQELKLDIADTKEKLIEANGLYLNKIERLNREKRLEVNKQTGELEDLKIALQNDRAISGSLNLQIEDSIVNPKILKIEHLEMEIKLTHSYYSQLINVTRVEYEFDQADITRTFEDLQQQLSFNLQKQRDLNVLALYDGYIKNVRVEKNTLMESFTPLVTYSKLTPVFVRAYTDEKTRLEVNLGSTVSVTSATRKWINIEGIIIAESKRITELPDRLKIQPYSQEWGQEFLVKLPANNEFLIGEKVLIR
jgi:multidrug resistance efflux pump